MVRHFLLSPARSRKLVPHKSVFAMDSEETRMQGGHFQDRKEMASEAWTLSESVIESR